jgi:hypothetical protein
LACRVPILSLAIVLVSSIVSGQETSADQSQQAESKRILGIIPNYRTSPIGSPHARRTVSEKFKVASEDSFDRGTFALAGISQEKLSLRTQIDRSVRAQKDSAAILARRTGISS